MERKFTDDEIVKTFEVCVKSECWGDCEDMGCPAATKQGCVFWLRTDEDYEGVIQTEMLKDALDLIKRQKAEIERLTEHNKILVDRVGNLVYECDCAKQEAIKEFAERLKQYCAPGGDFGDPCGVLTVTDRWIDHLIKEMMGEDDGN